MISRFFIDRPIFASVISIIIVLVGLLSIKALPISQYPEILPTTVNVSATYLGASAQTVANTVAAPIEQQINGVENMIYMQSNSSNNGQLSLTVTFNSEVNPAQAEIDVNNRVQAALALLPSEVKQAGVTVSRKASSILEVIALYSPDNSLDDLYMGNYALLNVLDDLKRVEGVGDATIAGAINYSMRIWLKPDKMMHHKVSVNDVQNAISEQNAQFALGKFGQEPTGEENHFTYSLTTKGRFSSVKEFENIIIKTKKNGANLKLKDVARIELGSQNYDSVSKLDGQSAIAIIINLQTGANALNTTKAVNEKIASIAKKFPTGMSYAIPFDTTSFVKISINEVIKTFLEAIILVTLVVFIFLQNLRATFIPLIAVPVSLIGAFGGMYLLGFSINLLTLFGMILAIGIVVDDAIIVIENVERIMREENLGAREATIKAMDEVAGPVIAIVLVLASVFIPVAFISGITGIIYRQFAVTIVIAVVLSGIVALTLTPALCANFIKHQHNDNRFFDIFNNCFSKFTDGYIKIVRFFVHNVKTALVLFSAVLVSLYFLYNKLPSSLVPDEDQGYLVSGQMLMPGSALSRTVKLVDKFIDVVKADPSVDHIVSLAGTDFIGGTGLNTSAGTAFIKLKDWSLRKNENQSSFNLAGKFMGMAAANLDDGIALIFNPPAIIGMSTTGGFEAYIEYHGSDANYTDIIAQVANNLVQKANTHQALTGVRTTFNNTTPIYEVTLDRTKAKLLSVSVRDVFAAMQNNFGTYYINDFSLYGRNYKVFIQAEENFRKDYRNISDIFVKSATGKFIPLSSLIKIEVKTGVNSLDRFNIFPAAKITGNSKAGYSSGQALDAIANVAKEVLPDDFVFSWSGSSYQEKASSKSGSLAFAFAIIMVFLILAALYEKWSLPFAVIFSVPFAVLGAVIFQYMRGLTNDVYFQVGLVTLIGLSAKNAILIIEFAVIEHQKGMSIKEAAIYAAKMRFRPIIMTSLAFILGCVPLYFSSGAGAASRHSIGTGIIGGMLASTFIAVFFIPLFFTLVNRPNIKNIEQNI